MRKKDEGLRGELLGQARRIAAGRGLGAVNIRSIAQGAGVSPGTVYNYFAGKEEILLALTEEYWQEALNGLEEALGEGPFWRQAGQAFAFLRGRMEPAAKELMAGLRGSGREGKARMASMQGALQEVLLRRLRADATLRPGVWDEGFTPEKFAHFVMTHMTAQLRAGEGDAAFLTEVIRRALY